MPSSVLAGMTLLVLGESHMSLADHLMEPLQLPIELFDGYQGNESAMVAAMPGIRPGATFNQAQRRGSLPIISLPPWCASSSGALAEPGLFATTHRTRSWPPMPLFPCCYASFPQRQAVTLALSR